LSLSTSGKITSYNYTFAQPRLGRSTFTHTVLNVNTSQFAFHEDGEYRGRLRDSHLHTSLYSDRASFYSMASETSIEQIFWIRGCI
jgi:hypothetical protein